MAPWRPSRSASFPPIPLQGLLPPGRNTLDGAYTCLGYTVQGMDDIKSLKRGPENERLARAMLSAAGHAFYQPPRKPLMAFRHSIPRAAGDVIEKAVVKSGMENLVVPK